MKSLIEKSQNRVRQLREKAKIEEMEASTKFMRLIRQEYEKERKRLAKCEDDAVKSLNRKVQIVGEGGKTQKRLEGEQGKVKVNIEKEIKEANSGMEKMQKQLEVNLKSSYEANVLRRQAVEESDELFRGISELLTSSRSD